MQIATPKETKESQERLHERTSFVTTEIQVAITRRYMHCGVRVIAALGGKRRMVSKFSLAWVL